MHRVTRSLLGEDSKRSAVCSAPTGETSPSKPSSWRPAMSPPWSMRSSRNIRCKARRSSESVAAPALSFPRSHASSAWTGTYRRTPRSSPRLAMRCRSSGSRSSEACPTPTGEEVARLVADVEEAAALAGADPETLQVETEAVPERGAVRAVALGAVALEEAAHQDDVSDEALRSLASHSLGNDDIDHVASTAFVHGLRFAVTRSQAFRPARQARNSGGQRRRVGSHGNGNRTRIQPCRRARVVNASSRPFHGSAGHKDRPRAPLDRSLACFISESRGRSRCA